MKIIIKKNIYNQNSIGQNDLGKVIAFGVGSRCSSPDNIDDDGCALLDCHALAMERRALLPYAF